MHALFFALSIALLEPQASREPKPPQVLVSWSGGDSALEEARFVTFTNQAEFDAVWHDVVVGRAEGRAARAGLKPAIDFTHCVGFAITAGKTRNSRGFRHLVTEHVGGAWHLRLIQDNWRGDGAGQLTTPYAIFLVQRAAGTTIVVDEAGNGRIDGAPGWQELGRFVIAPLAMVVAPAETGRFAPQVLAAIAEYRQFTRVSDRPNWSPLDCRAPPHPGPLVSESDSAGTHGRKLYFLYARDADAYRGKNTIREGDEPWSDTPLAPSNPAPVQQVIVKEAWHPVAQTGPAPEESRGAGLPATHAQYEGQLFRRGEQADLFVMLKLDPRTLDTDQGWVYASVTPDMRTVTAAGRIASCMECHATAEHDRQFGIPRDWPQMRRVPRER